MSVIAVCGLPGSGKTLFTTYLMLKHYKAENNIIKRIIKHDLKNKHVNIYSNYPIRLDKKHYSYQANLWDMSEYQKYYMDSDIIFDEFQLYFDSLDFKKFPKKIRDTFQLHRHFGIHDIYILSQHPSRLVKQARDLVCEFYRIKRFFKIPFLGIAFIRYDIYYNFDDYGKSTKVKKNEVNYDFTKRIKLFRYKKVFKSYDTKYMKMLVDNKEYINQKPFMDIDMTEEEIYNTFNLSN